MGAAQPRSLTSYLGVLRAHWFLALLALAATLGGAAAFLQLRNESYEATAEVLVTPIPAESQGLLALPLITEAADATRVSQTAAALLRNARAASDIVPRLPSGWDRERVQGAVAVQPRGESNVIALTATADDPDLAAALANLYTASALDVRNAELRREVRRRIASLQEQVSGEISPTERTELLRRTAALRSIERDGDPTLSLAQSASVPDESSSPSPVLVIAAAVAVGLGLAFGAALIASALDKRILDEEELQAMSGLPVLARIPDSTRAPARVQGAESFRTLTAQMEAADRPPRVVLFTSASSGDGKTTSALRLAHALRETGRTVAFLSFDLRKPFDRAGRGRRGRRGPLQDLTFDEKRRLRWGAPLAEGLVRSATDQDLAFALPESPKDSASRGAFSRQLARFTTEARESFDAVVIDTSPLGEVADALPLMEHADAIIVVVRLGATTRVAFSRMLDLMHRSGITPFGVLLVGGGSDLPSPYYRDLAGAGAPGRV